MCQTQSIIQTALQPRSAIVGIIIGWAFRQETGVEWQFCEEKGFTQTSNAEGLTLYYTRLATLYVSY